MKDKKEVSAFFKQLGSCASIEDARTLLVEKQAEFENDYDERDKAILERDNALNDCEKLRKTNMKLFLQVGDDKETDKGSGKEKEPANEELTYENLFNKEGRLK